MSSVMVSSVGSPAGTMIQTERGAVRAVFNSLDGRDSSCAFGYVVVAYIFAAVVDDNVVAAFNNRSAMLPPMRPKPIIAICIYLDLVWGW